MSTPDPMGTAAARLLTLAIEQAASGWADRERRETMPAQTRLDYVTLIGYRLSALAPSVPTRVAPLSLLWDDVRLRCAAVDREARAGVNGIAAGVAARLALAASLDALTAHTKEVRAWLAAKQRAEAAEVRRQQPTLW